MKRKLVTIQIIKDLNPIPEADKIEVAKIKGWSVVVRKDEFKIGDRVLYFEIDSFLPVRPEYDFLLRGSKPKKMLSNGKEIEGIRLKTIKLRNQISQGLIMPIPERLQQKTIGADVTEELGVIKYEQPIPAELAGKVKGSFPSFIPKTDEERIQNMEGVLSNFYVSEKLDGTSMTIFRVMDEIRICSRNLEIEEGVGTQWKIAEKLELEKKMPLNMAIQGELMGEGIQKNPLKLTGQELYCFNVYNIKTKTYLNFEDFTEFCRIYKIPTVPIIDDNFALPDSVDKLLQYAEGKSLLNKDCEREGVVIRPKIEMIYQGERLSFKAISNKYLLKNE